MREFFPSVDFLADEGLTSTAQEIFRMSYMLVAIRKQKACHPFELFMTTS